MRIFISYRFPHHLLNWVERETLDRKERDVPGVEGEGGSGRRAGAVLAEGAFAADRRRRRASPRHAPRRVELGNVAAKDLPEDVQHRQPRRGICSARKAPDRRGVRVGLAEELARRERRLGDPDAPEGQANLLMHIGLHAVPHQDRRAIESERELEAALKRLPVADRDHPAITRKLAELLDEALRVDVADVDAHVERHAGQRPEARRLGGRFRDVSPAGQAERSFSTEAVAGRGTTDTVLTKVVE